MYHLVLHNQKFLEFEHKVMGGENRPFIDPHDLVPVAIVDAKSTQDAYFYTQHLNQLWHDNENVYVLVRSRSTSVGDVIFCDTDDGLAGSAWVVMPFGWEPLTQFNNQFDAPELRRIKRER